MAQMEDNENDETDENDETEILPAFPQHRAHPKGHLGQVLAVVAAFFGVALLVCIFAIGAILIDDRHAGHTNLKGHPAMLPIVLFLESFGSALVHMAHGYWATHTPSNNTATATFLATPASPASLLGETFPHTYAAVLSAMEHGRECIRVSPSHVWACVRDQISHR
jgi:hypothetical protein